MKVRLLGSPEITRDGARVEVDTRKAIALIAYLAVSGPVVTRDQAAALLWPDHDHTRARGALRRTLSTLRRAVGDDHVHATRQQIELLPTGLDIDVLQFEDLARMQDPASLRAAWDLYRGDFLLGFGLRDSAEFDHWQRREAERLRDRATAVLDRLAELAVRHGAFTEAIGYAERRLSLDPLSEPAHRQLMELEARRGERGAAVARYRTLVRVLSDELGVEPLEQTTAAYEAIRRGTAPPEPAVPAVEVTDDSPLPFTGRHAEVDAIVAAVPRSRRHGHLVLIEGDAGMGTTRLLDETADRLRRTGAVVSSVRCNEHESELGYASIIGLVRGLLGRRNAAEVDLPPQSAALVAELVPELATTSAPPSSRFSLYEALTETILSLADGPGPPVIALDDVHRIDRAGGSYLRYLVNRLRTIPVAIVATVHPDEAESPEPMTQLARALERREQATVVRIGALTAEHVAELVAATDCDPVDPEELWRITGGVPLYVAELLRSGCAEGMVGGRVPEGLVPVVAGRLDRLGANANQILTAVAVLGEPADADLVRRVAGRSVEEVAEGLDLLVRAHVLVPDEAGGYVAANAIVQRVAYERLGPERKRLLHHRAAAALDGDPQRQRSAAGHYNRAGDREAAARAYVAAGDEARRVFAHHTATACYQAALELGHDDAEQLRESLGDLATAAGRYAEARRQYELAAATRSGADLARLEHKLGLLHLRIGHPDIALSHLRSALAEDEGADGSTMARVLADTAAAHLAAGGLEEAAETIDRARLAAEGTNDAAALAAVENVRGLFAVQCGDEPGARQAFERSLHLAEVDGDESLTVAAANNLALALTRAGEAGRARELFESALELAMRTGEEHRAAALHSNLADFHQRGGDTAAAAAHIRRMAELMAEIGAQFEEPTPGIWMQTAW